jgi:hypothetical protein
MFMQELARNRILLSIVAVMRQAGIYDLQNIILIAVEMHSVRYPSALGH